MSPGWGRGSNRRCPFAGPSSRGHHNRRCSCLGVSPISVSPSFSPPSQTWLEFLVQNGFCDYKREETKAEPSFEITLPDIASAGSNIIRSPISSPGKQSSPDKLAQQEKRDQEGEPGLHLGDRTRPGTEARKCTVPGHHVGRPRWQRLLPSPEAASSWQGAPVVGALNQLWQPPTVGLMAGRSFLKSFFFSQWLYHLILFWIMKELELGTANLRAPSCSAD